MHFPFRAARPKKTALFWEAPSAAKKLPQAKRKHNGSVFAAVAAGAGAGRGAVVGTALPSHDAIHRSMSH